MEQSIIIKTADGDKNCFFFTIEEWEKLLDKK